MGYLSFVMWLVPYKLDIQLASRKFTTVPKISVDSLHQYQADFGKSRMTFKPRVHCDYDAQDRPYLDSSYEITERFDL